MEKRLYHATTARGLNGILGAGAILPARETGEQVWRHAHDKVKAQGYIYLGEKNQVETIGQYIQREYGGTIYILEVEIPDEENLRPDEDSGETDWRRSLETTRTCAYEGKIPSWKIAGWLDYDLSQDEKKTTVRNLLDQGIDSNKFEEIYEEMRLSKKREESNKYGEIVI